MKTVLVIEDDKEIASLLELHLKDIGCATTRASDGRAGLEAARSGSFDLIVLDIMLPGLDGIEVCRELRKKDQRTPVMMLTARSEELDKVLGLEIGADDYLTKPFSIREFVARAKAILRRSEALNQEAGAPKDIHRGALVIEVDKRKVLLDGGRVELTPKEFDLLLLLASHPGRTYSREELLNLVWGYQYAGYEHTVNSHINRLRAKIERDATNPRYILTTWGVGYRFNDEETR